MRRPGQDLARDVSRIISDAYLDAMTVEDQAIRHARRMLFRQRSSWSRRHDRRPGDRLCKLRQARGMPPASTGSSTSSISAGVHAQASLRVVRSVAGHCRDTGGSSLFAWVLKGNPTGYSMSGSVPAPSARAGSASAEKAWIRWPIAGTISRRSPTSETRLSDPRSAGLCADPRQRGSFAP